MRIEQGFQQIPFSEENPYVTDPVLPSLLKRTLPLSILQKVEPDLIRLGADVITSIRELGNESKVKPPTLVQYDQWGRRVDDLQTSEAWRNLKALAQREGLPGIFYERKYKEHSRIYGFAKILLMVGDTHEIFCPMSMTDGSARVIELLGTHEMKNEILPRLVSRDPTFAFTSGQWMTERPGGSDVSQTETTAVPTNIGSRLGRRYTLNGLKWFSSATDSEISVGLARTGALKDGSRGLSLFLIPLRLPLLRAPSDPVPSPVSNGIFIHRLKNKIGTHALPTAELLLESTEGYLLGPINKGVKNITPVLNITRIWSATTSIGHLRKCLATATAYAKVRTVDGGKRLLQDVPIHLAQLASINILYRSLTHLTFGAVSLLGKADCNVATPDELKRLRLLTPVVKAYCAEKATAAMEEAMTALGGAGYMEENGFGRAIRDALVEKIWEGTTTVLSLDLARAAQDPATMTAFISWAQNVIDSAPPSLAGKTGQAIETVKTSLQTLAQSYHLPLPPLLPRPALMLMGTIASAVYLLEHAIWAHIQREIGSDIDMEAFRRWVLEGDMETLTTDVIRAKTSVNQRISVNSQLVFGVASKPKL